VYNECVAKFFTPCAPDLVAGAAANRLQDYCSRVKDRCLHGLAPAYLSVDLQSIEDLPAVETATTVMVVGHVSRPCVEAIV